MYPCNRKAWKRNFANVRIHGLAVCVSLTCWIPAWDGSMDGSVCHTPIHGFFLEKMLINHEMLCPVSRHMALSDRESQLSDASSLLSNNVGKTIVNHPQNHQFHRWYKPSNMGWFSINFLFYPDRNGPPSFLGEFPHFQGLLDLQAIGTRLIQLKGFAEGWPVRIPRIWSGLTHGMSPKKLHGNLNRDHMG